MALQEYLENLYEEANEELDEENFKQAEVLFTEIKKFDSDYKDVHSLQNFSKTEPLYRQALSDFEKENYRAAYNNCIKIEKIEPGYKDIDIIKADALEHSNGGSYI